MKRVVDSWPYVVGVVALVLGWVIVARLPLAADEVTTLVTLYLGSLAPLVVAGGGAALGYRHGYDWVTVVACVVVAIIGTILGGLVATGAVPNLAAAATALAAYTAAGHVGLVAALGVKRLGR
jgi:hypothetical protein